MTFVFVCWRLFDFRSIKPIDVFFLCYQGTFIDLWSKRPIVFVFFKVQRDILLLLLRLLWPIFFTMYSAGFFWEHHGQFCQLCQAYAIHTAGVNQNLWLLNSFSWAELSMHVYAVPELMGSLEQFIFLKHLFFPCV